MVGTWRTYTLTKSLVITLFSTFESCVIHHYISPALVMLTSLPPELLLKIIYSLRTSSSDDLQTLQQLSLICRRFNRIIQSHRKDIIEYYTISSIEDGDICYRFCGQLHRDNDLPAVIKANGTQKWYTRGQLHRDNDLPA